MKAYEKPELFIEHFELAQHIAGCKGITLNSADEKSCSLTGSGNVGGLGDRDVTGWFVNAEFCDVLVNDYCYTNGEGGPQVFTS